MTVPLLTLIIVLAWQTAVWAVSLRLRDVTIVDVLWGLSFVPVLLAVMVKSPPVTLRDELLLALITIWAVRLGWHIWSRWKRAGHEDRRYAAMRAKAGDKFARQSLFTVFWAQGFVTWIVSWPLQAALMAPPVPFGPLDYIGVTIAVGGMVLEAIADTQLTRFTEDPRNHGKVLTSGAWAWSRHPNYFGDAAMWWGLFLICLAASGAWWTVVGPLLMTFVLLRVSGVALTEKTITQRRPAYTEYIKRTPAFVPRRPRSR